MCVSCEPWWFRLARASITVVATSAKTELGPVTGQTVTKMTVFGILYVTVSPLDFTVSTDFYYFN